MQGDDTLLGRVRNNLANFGGRLAVLLIGVGLLAILLGWNGAASDIRVAAQIPYLISGLGVGLGMVGVGVGVMVVQSAREDRARLEAKLDVLVDAVTRSGGSYSTLLDNGTPAAGMAAPAAVPPDLAGLVIAGSASYHVPGCKLVDGREEVTYLTPDEARARWLSPCRVCQPDRAEVSS